MINLGAYFRGNPLPERDHIEHVRPLIGLRTPFGRMIEDHHAWLRLIEPKIIRPQDSSCWFWDGALNNEGEPYINVRDPATGRLRPTTLKRLVAGWFWDLKPRWDVIHGCLNLNCLNPRHFYVTNLHWKQHNRPEIIRNMALRIRRWGKDKE